MSRRHHVAGDAGPFQPRPDTVSVLAAGIRTDAHAVARAIARLDLLDKCGESAALQLVREFARCLFVRRSCHLDGELATAARDRGLPVGIVGIADRAYRPDGTLVPRSEPGAVLHDEVEIAERTVRMVVEGEIISVTGSAIAVQCDTVLLHGDNPAAISLARRIRADLQAAGVRIAPLRESLAVIA